MLNVLQNILLQINTEIDFKQKLQILVKEVKHILDVDVCSVYLIEKQSKELVLKASDGLLKKSIDAVRLRFNKGIVGLVAERAELINLANAHKHPRYHYFSETGEEAYHGFLGVPIIHNGEAIGVLVLQNSIKQRFSEEIVTLISTLATQLSEIIIQAQAKDDIKLIQKSADLNSNLKFTGIACAPGIAIGTAVVIDLNTNIENIPDKLITDIDAEETRLMAAIRSVKSEIQALLDTISDTHPDIYTSLFDAYLLMLDSQSFSGAIREEIRKGNWAQGALRKVIMDYIITFREMDDPYLKQRVEDVRDLSKRVLIHLNQTQHKNITYPENTILVGDELTASMLVDVPKSKLAGIIANKGSTTSHIAILSAALGVPAVLGIEEIPIDALDGLNIIVNGYSGYIHINADNNLSKEYQHLIIEDKRFSQNLWKERNQPSISRDGHLFPIYANTGIVSDITPAINSGSEGIGLYRTEFSYLDNDYFPGENEQQAIYQHVLESFKPCSVTMRTLDVGGDKELPYFPISELNPFLGWRGIRITLDHPEIFLIQVRAMIRANSGNDNLRILLPMITTIPELDKAIALIKQAHREINEEGVKSSFPQIGVMIEVPSLIYLIGAISKRADFISIGSNDLTQYLLAVDRNNAHVASLYDSLHPSVITAVHHIVNSARTHHIPVSICGEMASDPMAVILLMGMGIDSLSMNSSSIPGIKWVIRNFSKSKAEEIFLAVMQMEDSQSIRTFLSNELEQANLGGLIRAGN